MKTLLLVLLLMSTTVSTAIEAPLLLVFGDSLSAAHGFDRVDGWVNLLRARLREQDSDYQVANASISGDTTAGGLARMPQELDQQRPKIVLLELGANDGLRGLDLVEMRINLTRMIEMSQAVGAQVVLFEMRLPPNLGRAFTEKFRGIYHDLAARYSLPLVPFFLDGVAQVPALMQSDGLHPNAQAQPRMLENVWPILEPLLTG